MEFDADPDEQFTPETMAIIRDSVPELAGLLQYANPRQVGARDIFLDACMYGALGIVKWIVARTGTPPTSAEFACGLRLSQEYSADHVADYLWPILARLESVERITVASAAA